MSHPNAKVVREFYAARARGDRAAVRALLADDVAWHDPYPPPHGGDLVGADAVFASVFDAAGEITGGTTRFEVHDVLASDEHAVSLVEWSSSIPGRGSISGREVAVFHVSDGRIAEVWFYPEDQAAYAAFFA